MTAPPPFMTIRSRRPTNGYGYGPANGATPATADFHSRSATHDVSRTSFHVQDIKQFATRVETSAARAFPNRGRTSQRYKSVQSLLLHWGSDDLFVLPELEDLDECLRKEYFFGTDKFSIPSENSHLELMMRVGQLIKEHEDPDTLFLIYYGGHARIDESRQSTWCATREADSPWLQWSAIQTLLERSKSDVLILLDCCAGAASATFPTGTSITETISASSWDAIAPDPGLHSFTNVLIEVLLEWRMRAFSAAMLHAEILARLKHPRPIHINGTRFEARSTPVHFMMTSNHRAPSIELSRTIPAVKVVPAAEDGADSLPAAEATESAESAATTDAVQPADPAEVVPNGLTSNEPNEDVPHVMISLALEEDQRLDIHAWEQWLTAFPAMAKYVKIQGVFKSHSTLLLVSMPVTVWDMLPEDHATTFVAFIRSNNLMTQKRQTPPTSVSVTAAPGAEEVAGPDSESINSNQTTVVPTAGPSVIGQNRRGSNFRRNTDRAHGASSGSTSPILIRPAYSGTSLDTLQRYPGSGASMGSEAGSSPFMVLNQQQSQRRTVFGDDVPEARKFAAHVESRLEDYYNDVRDPNDAQKAILASNLGVETWDLDVWFYHRRQRDEFTRRFATMTISDNPFHGGNGPRMVLPADLSQLLDMSHPGQTMLFDQRSPAEYARSHVYGAINLRVPRSFLQVAPLDMIERAIPDKEGRAAFSHWQSARCLVFYAKGLEFPWECPAANFILSKLHASGWSGQCFILKGNYREFSGSFDKYIIGSKMTQEAQQRIRSHASTPAISAENQERYTSWLSQVETQDRARPAATSTAWSEERNRTLESQEQDLDTEFQARFGELYRKAMELHPDTSMGPSDSLDSFDSKAMMVEHLDRGLDKMREAQGSQGSPPATTSYEPGHSKLDEEDYFERSPPDHDIADEYIEVQQTDEAQPATSSSRRRRGGSGQPTEETVRGGGGRGGFFQAFRRS